MGRNWLVHDGMGSVRGGTVGIHDGTGSEEGGTCWYMAVLGQYGPVLVAS